MIEARALEAVPGCEEGRPPLAIERLGEASTNAAFRVRTVRGAFVLRIHPGGPLAPGVDRQREALLQARAARAGLAPAVVASDPLGGYLITEYLDEPAWRSQDMADAAKLAALARRLGALHALEPVAVAPLDLAALLEQHAASIERAEEASGPALAPLLERARQILLECASGERRHCIVHGDLYHGNLLGPAPWLIDWEYASVSDPLNDLACILAYYPQASSHAQLLLAESGLEACASPELLGSAAWVYVLVSYLWFRRLRLAGTPTVQDLSAEAELLARLVLMGHTSMF